MTLGGVGPVLRAFATGYYCGLFRRIHYNFTCWKKADYSEIALFSIKSDIWGVGSVLSAIVSGYNGGLFRLLCNIKL